MSSTLGASGAWLEEKCKKRLRVEAIWGILVHNPDAKRKFRLNQHSDQVTGAPMPSSPEISRPANYNVRSARNTRTIANVMGFTCSGGLLFNLLALRSMNPPHPASYLILCSVIGGLIGWGVAVLATPRVKDDETTFAKYAKIISGFLSGWLVAKVDKPIQNLFEDPKAIDARIAVRIGYFVAFFLIGLMWTFLLRRNTESVGEG